ncbi:MAG: sigma-70 family RNA polymerase sigma factor [Bacteroidota bacterium]
MEEKFLEELYQNQALIHKVCNMYRDTVEDREDLFQEIVYQLWKAYPKFQGRSKISSWIYRIGLNTAMATFRKPKIKLSKNNKNLENVELPQTFMQESNNEQLLAAIKKLNEADKALVMLYLEEMSYTEIAEIIGISENYVGVRLNRIKGKIKKSLNV